jgi:hypothetical protein
MATLIPKQEPSKAPASEKKVYRRLRDLDDACTVLHSVNWQSKRGGRQGDGEADFVLLNASSGVTVLEVKGGQVTLEEGWWYSTDRNGQRNPIKNPYEQAVASKHALIDYLRQAGLPMQRIPVNYAVVFPDITLRAPLGPAGPREISWDANDLRDIRAASRRTAAHWGASCRMTTAELRRIIELLAPTVVVRRRLLASPLLSPAWLR